MILSSVLISSQNYLTNPSKLHSQILQNSSDRKQAKTISKHSCTSTLQIPPNSDKIRWNRLRNKLINLCNYITI